MEEEKPNQMEYVDEYYEEPSYHEADIVEEPKVVEKKPELIL